MKGPSGSQLNKILHMKSYQGEELQKRSSHKLKNMGGNQYRGEIALRSGRTEFVVGSKRWWIDIPASSEGVDHLVLLSLSTPNRFVIFEASLAN